MFPEVVETERLRLERLCHDTVDARGYYELLGDGAALADVVEHMPWEPHAHPKETVDMLDRAEEQWADGEAAKWVVRLREGEAVAEEAASLPGDGRPIAGQTGLRPDWDARSTSLSVWLRPPYWGRGYSGERAAAQLQVAFEHLDLEAVAVTHVVDNDRSRRAIERYVERFGGRREGRLRNYVPFDDGARDAVRYSITREEYRESGGAPEVTVRA